MAADTLKLRLIDPQRALNKMRPKSAPLPPPSPSQPSSPAHDTRTQKTRPGRAERNKSDSLFLFESIIINGEVIHNNSQTFHSVSRLSTDDVQTVRHFVFRRGAVPSRDGNPFDYPVVQYF